VPGSGVALFLEEREQARQNMSSLWKRSGQRDTLFAKGMAMIVSFFFSEPPEGGLDLVTNRQDAI